MNLEAQAIKGGILYLESIERDLTNRKLVFRLVGTARNGSYSEPNLGEVVRILEFTEINNFQEFWDEEEDPGLMEQIIGIHESPQSEGCAYVIRLYQSEMHFDSDRHPIIKDIPDAAVP